MTIKGFILVRIYNICPRSSSENERIEIETAIKSENCARASGARASNLVFELGLQLSIMLYRSSNMIINFLLGFQCIFSFVGLRDYGYCVCFIFGKFRIVQQFITKYDVSTKRAIEIMDTFSSKPNFV